jgi:hypothetical protein
VDGNFPVFEYGWGHVSFTADDGGVIGSSHHRSACALTQFGRGSDVVDMAVGQYDPVDTRHNSHDLGARSRCTRIDQRHRIPVAPDVELPAIHPQHGQLGGDGGRVHRPTLSRRDDTCVVTSLPANPLADKQISACCRADEQNAQNSLNSSYAGCAHKRATAAVDP